MINDQLTMNNMVGLLFDSVCFLQNGEKDCGYFIYIAIEAAVGFLVNITCVGRH
jgi:hypothetical protein